MSGVKFEVDLRPAGVDGWEVFPRKLTPVDGTGVVRVTRGWRVFAELGIETSAGADTISISEFAYPEIYAQNLLREMRKAYDRIQTGITTFTEEDLVSNEQNDSTPVDTLTTELEQLKLSAEREKLEAEVAILRHDERKRSFEAENARLSFLEYRKDAEREASKDIEHGYFYFDHGVGGQAVNTYRALIHQYARRNPGKPISIDFNSPGGSVLDGFAWYDSLRRLSSEGHEIRTRVAGVAASMAGVLLQSGDVRVIGARSWLHLHEVSTGAIGKASDIMDQAEFAKRLTEQICDIYAERSHLSASEIWDLMHRQEVWLTPKEALANGFVDLIE